MYYDENSSSSGSEERGSSGSDNSFDSRHNRGDGGCSRSRKDTRSPAAGLVVGSVDVEDPGTEQGPQRGWKQRMCCGRGAGSPAGKTGKGDAAPSWFVLQRTKFRLQRVRFSACCSDCCAVLCLLPVTAPSPHPPTLSLLCCAATATTTTLQEEMRRSPDYAMCESLPDCYENAAIAIFPQPGLIPMPAVCRYCNLYR